MKNKWEKFKTETNLDGAYRVNELEKVEVKLISRVPKGYYYSCLNEVLLFFEENIEPKLRQNESN